MRQVSIYIDGRMVGALWLRGRIEISDTEGVVSSYWGIDQAQFYLPVSDSRIQYRVWTAEVLPQVAS